MSTKGDTAKNEWNIVSIL